MESSKWDAVRNGGGVARVHPDAPVVQVTNVSTWPWPWLVASAFAVLWALRWAQVRFLEWRSRVLRRETRRRYGIPDTDDRPFHIAYNAAATTRRQRELEELAKKREEDNASRPQYPDPTSAPPPSALDGALRRRQFSQQAAVVHQPVHFNSQPIIDTRAPYGALRRPNTQHAPSYPSTHYQQQPQQQQQQQEPDWTHRYDPNAPPAPPAQAPRIVSSRKGVARLDFGSNFVERRKHVLGGVPFPVEPATRKTKRQQSDNDTDDAGYRKRARRHDGLEVDRDAEMGDAEDEGESTDAMDTDAGPLHRVSLKRHRSDAASVAGAEDDQPRSRKLRKKGADKSSVPVSKTARGTKRDRLAEEDEDEEQPVRHKRGRSQSITSSSDEEMADEVPEPVQEPEIEVEASCGNRQVGDEWSEGDVQYKVGPQGQRLRLAHIKQFRTRPVKAKDFATNKPPVQVPIVVEQWLDDAEFESAKEKKELAWGYDTDEEGSLPEASAEDSAAKQIARITAEPSPSGSRASTGGKVLLWDTPSRSARTTPGSTPGLSPASDALSNPFARTNGAGGAGLGARGKRIATGGSSVERPDQLRYSRSFSKWEKQEAEAEALSALRRKEKEKEEEEKKKKAPPPAPSFASTPLPTATPSSTGTAASSNPLFFKAPDAGASKPSAADKPPATSAATEPPKLSFPASTAAPKPASGDAAPKTGFTFGPLPGSTPSAGVDTAKLPATGGLNSAFTLPPNPLLAGTAPKPAATTPSFAMPTAAPSTGPSLSFSAAGKDKEAPKPAGGDAPKFANSFSFGPLPGSTPAAADAAKTSLAFPSAPSSMPNPAASTASGDANKPLFGPPSTAARSPFGFPAPGSTPAATTAPGSEPAKPAFNLFGPSSGAGASASTQPAKPASGGFGFPTPSPAPSMGGTEGSKSAFSFATAPAAGAPGSTGTEAPKPMFSLPTPTTAAPAAPKPSVSFPTRAPASGAPAAGGASSFFATPPTGLTPPVATSNPFAPSAGGSAAAAAAAPTLNALGRPMRAMRGSKSPGPTNALTPGAPAGPTPAAPSGSAFSFGNPSTSAPSGAAASPFGSFTAPAGGGVAPAPSSSGSGFGLFGGATGAGTGSTPAAAPAASGFSFGAPSAAPTAGAAAAGPPSLFGAPSTATSLFGGAAAPGTPGAQQPQSSTPFGTPSTSTGFTFGSQK